MTSRTDTDGSCNLSRQLEAYDTSVAAAPKSARWSEHLQSWPVYAAAAGSSLALATSVGAGPIVYSGLQNVALNLTSINQVVTAPINIDGIGGAEMALWLRNVLTFNDGRNSAALDAGGVTNPAFFLLNGSAELQRLASGALISAGSFTGGNRGLNRFDTFVGTGTIAGTWPFPGTGFAGFKFQQSGQPHFGWIRLRLERGNPIGSAGPTRLTAIDWAYDAMANNPILAGNVGGTPIPESNSLLAVLAAGSAGVLAWRRRRHAATADSPAA